jgi:hypothetical protein
MAFKLTFMFKTIKFLSTWIFARKFWSWKNLTSNSLFLFTTETFYRNLDLTRRTTSRMT